MKVSFVEGGVDDGPIGHSLHLLLLKFNIIDVLPAWTTAETKNVR